MNRLFLRLQKLKICTTCPFYYTSVPDLREPHVANQQYSPFTMADDLFSSALPPSPPHTILPLNNNINKVPIQEKTSKFGQELTEVAPKLDMDNTTAASGSLLSLCYHSVLLSPTATHTHSHARNAVSIPERTTFSEKEILHSPNEQYSTDSEGSQPSSSETMETEEMCPKTLPSSINTNIPDEDLMWCNSSDSNTTTRGDNTNLLPESPVTTPTKPAQQNISFGNAFSSKTFLPVNFT